MSASRILIVDDHEENIYLLRALLQADGYEVSTAPNGAEALAQAHLNPPDMIISDVLMPVMDGFTLCREWKKDPRLAPVPFVFYTATYTDERDREFALSLGAEAFIVKPEEPEVFREKIHGILGKVKGLSTPGEKGEGAPVEETVYLKQYNEALIRKLEAKMAQLEKTIRELERENAERLKSEAERESLRDQLFQAQKMESIGRLAGGVAHDFNNMLSVIISYTDLVRSQLKPDDPLRDDLQKILEAARRSADLTRQLLTFARKETVTLKVIDLNEAVKGMIRFLERILGDNIQLSFPLQGKPGRVRVGSSHLDQILTNLCVNARDAIQGHGRIDITTGAAAFDEAYCANHPGFYPGDFLRLSVSDNGCGMKEEVLAKVFEPFYTTKGPGQGTGLGLSTVYGIVQQNKGFIKVKSQLGVGTTFDIYLPRYDGPLPAAPAESLAVPLARGQTNILLVEDEPAILQITSRILKNLGYTILPYPSPREALLRIRDHSQVHLLITDVIMPEMSGMELAKKVQPLFPGLKCLYMSGYTADSSQLEEGVHFIQKPFTIKELAEKVHEVLGN
jgi:signal transduction histidine kinase/FixJ family two-component response regulator